MEYTRHRSRHPQSPTHRSPDLPHPSLTGLAQSYECNHEPTAAQIFAQQQRQQQLEQKLQQGFSVGSSTAVNSGVTEKEDKSVPSISSISLFESAISKDDIDGFLNVPTDEERQATCYHSIVHGVNDGDDDDGYDDYNDDDGDGDDFKSDQDDRLTTESQQKATSGLQMLSTHMSRAAMIDQGRSSQDGYENTINDFDKSDDINRHGVGNGSEDTTFHANSTYHQLQPVFLSNHNNSIEYQDHVHKVEDNNNNGDGDGDGANNHNDDGDHTNDYDYDDDVDDDDNEAHEGDDAGEEELQYRVRQTQDEEIRGYRRTPRGVDVLRTRAMDDGDEELLETQSKNGTIGNVGDHAGGIWYDYQPDYGMLNESYQATKSNIYKDIQLTLGKLQQLESRFEASKHQFHGRIEKEYEEWSQQLDLQQQYLEQHKRSLDEKEPRSITTFHNKIKLNVGGVTFETSLATLKKDKSSLLAMMFSGKHALQPESEGSYFIDRDPRHFRLVLNYLRDLRIPPSVIQDTSICQELLHEAQYYRIEGLISLLQQ